MLLSAVVLVCVVTIAADLEGGAAAIGLMVHANWQWFVVPLAAVLVALLTIGRYDELQNVLQYVLVGFVAYAASAFPCPPALGHRAARVARAPVRWSSDWTGGALALMGTTLTSYVYVWQTIEESEDAAPTGVAAAEAYGATAGILFGVLIFWFILVGTGATLGVHHRQVQTAQEAAEALRPVAGAAASYVFAIGLLISAIVALPVLMATCGYVVGAQLDWDRGLSAAVRNARASTPCSPPPSSSAPASRSAVSSPSACCSSPASRWGRHTDRPRLPPARGPQPGPDGRPAHLGMAARGRVGGDRVRQCRERPRPRPAAAR